jgi:hypothetical protein
MIENQFFEALLAFGALIFVNGHKTSCENFVVAPLGVGCHSDNA